MKNYYVYLLINSLDAKVFYVGKGMGERIYIHVRTALRGHVIGNNYKKYNKIRSIYKKHGKVLYAYFAKDLTNEQANRLERAKIKAIGRKNLTNLTDGGEGGGMTGKHHSKEFKKILSERMNGNKYRLGYAYTDAEKKKLSASHMGNTALLGHRHSEETKRKMSLSHKGKIPWNKGKKKVV